MADTDVASVMRALDNASKAVDKGSTRLMEAHGIPGLTRSGVEKWCAAQDGELLVRCYRNGRALCMCGCDEYAPIAKTTLRARGYVAGSPIRFVKAQHSKRVPLHKKFRVEANGCWTWLANLNWDGYGQMQAWGAQRRAHRVFFEVMVGPVPEGHELDHRCRNRACVNPAHLRPVTHTENMRRAVNTKLDEHDVELIRTSTMMTQQELADLIGCSQSMVSMVKRGEAWL